MYVMLPPIIIHTRLLSFCLRVDRYQGFQIAKQITCFKVLSGSGEILKTVQNQPQKTCWANKYANQCKCAGRREISTRCTLYAWPFSRRKEG